MVLEELVLEKFDPNKPRSWEKANLDMKVSQKMGPSEGGGGSRCFGCIVLSPLRSFYVSIGFG